MIYRIFNSDKDRYIVLIHCVCGNEKIFKSQIEDLASRYNIIIVRLAGHDIYSDIREASIDYVAKEIYDFIVANGIRKVDILGVSLGSMIASRYATLYPQTVSNLYLEGAIYRFSLFILNFMYLFFIKINRILPRRLYMLFITYALLPDKSEKQQREKLYNYSLHMKKDFLYKWMKEMGRFIKAGKKELLAVNNLNMNVLFIYGERDRMFFDYIKKVLKKHDSLKKIIALKGAGHLCNMQKKEDFNKIILKGGE